MWEQNIQRAKKVRHFSLSMVNLFTFLINSITILNEEKFVIILIMNSGDLHSNKAVYTLLPWIPESVLTMQYNFK